MDELGKKIIQLKSKNDWQGIINLFEPLDTIKDNPRFWKSTFILDAISFATAKLSEVYINLKFNFKTDEERKEFLKLKKKLRDFTVLFRKRLIELRPDNPGYYSNLAYSYYQFCNELTLPGGRRDGDLLECADKALEYINNALKIEPNRISDLYRKGQILCSVLPPNLLFKGGKMPDSEVIKTVREKIKEGIKSFKKAEEIYEIIPLVDEKSLKRYFKEYVKSLYNIAKSYSDLVVQSSSLKNYFFEKENYDKDESPYYQNDIENINRAIEYIDKCIIKDNHKLDNKNALPEGTIAGEYTGEIEGVFKLYSAGKYFFQKYIILINNNDNINAEEAGYLAEKYFRKALKCRWSKEKTSQNKAFIAEKLARYYITKSDFEKAEFTLNPFIKNRTDYYVRYTYAFALYKLQKYNEAILQINQALAFEKANKEISLGFLMAYFIYTGMGENKKAQEYLNNYKKIKPDEFLTFSNFSYFSKTG